MLLLTRNRVGRRTADLALHVGRALSDPHAVDVIARAMLLGTEHGRAHWSSASHLGRWDSVPERCSRMVEGWIGIWSTTVDSSRRLTGELHIQRFTSVRRHAFQLPLQERVVVMLMVVRLRHPLLLLFLLQVRGQAAIVRRVGRRDRNVPRMHAGQAHPVPGG